MKKMTATFAELREAQEAVNSAEAEIRRRLSNSYTVIRDVMKKERPRGNVTTHSFFDWMQGLWNADITITEDERFPVKVNGQSVHRIFIYGSTWEVAKFTRETLRLAQMKENESEVTKLSIRIRTAEDKLDGQKANLRKKYERDLKALEVEHKRAHAAAEENLKVISSRLEKLRKVVPTS